MVNVKKLFDTVNHNILIKKLEFYGIRGVTNQLINNYLLNRKQFVLMNDKSSQLRKLEIGVPLGSLFYLIHVNDLPNALHITPRLFADDTCLVFHEKNLNKLELEINNEMEKKN